MHVTVGVVVAAGMFLVLCRVQPGSLVDIGLVRNIYMHHLHYLHCILILMLRLQPAAPLHCTPAKT